MCKKCPNWPKMHRSWRKLAVRQHSIRTARKMKTKFHSVEARGRQPRWLNIITWWWLRSLRLKRDGVPKNALQRCVCLYPYSICNDLSSLLHLCVWCERSRVIVVILFCLEFSFIPLFCSLLKTAEYRYASYLCSYCGRMLLFDEFISSLPTHTSSTRTQ